MISIPIHQNPIFDGTGAKTVASQQFSSSPVFYLANARGVNVVRTITIPSGKGVLIPVMVVEVSDKERPGEPLDVIAKTDQDSVTDLYLNINGNVYGDTFLREYRIPAPTAPFDVEFPDNPIYYASPGKSKAVADGYYIITEVLPEGNHEIRFKSSLACQGANCFEPHFNTDVTYKITVR